MEHATRFLKLTHNAATTGMAETPQLLSIQPRWLLSGRRVVLGWSLLRHDGKVKQLRLSELL